MKTGILIGVVLVVAVLGVGIYLISTMSNPTSSNNNGGNANGGTSNTGNSGGDSGGNPGTTETKDVQIKSFAFNPLTITVSKGSTIRWTNMDSVLHTIVSDSGNEISSNSLSNSGTYSHTFNSAGTYSYHCGIHSSMKGKIIVQ